MLPGVTVEAASPVLIEKVRTAVTDGSGRYQIADLRPGAYTVTFTLAGFNTVRRDDDHPAGSANRPSTSNCASAPSRRPVTVTGEAPIVDTSSASRQAVLTADTIDALPTSRNYLGLATSDSVSGRRRERRRRV